MISRSRRLVFVLSLTVAALTSCDSFPGAFAPEGGNWPGVLRVLNTGSRRITLVEARCDAQTRTIQRTIDLGPSQTWFGRYPEGFCAITFEFNSGGGWVGTATFAAGDTVQMGPW